MISDESGYRFFPTAGTDYWQDRASIAYQQTDFSGGSTRICAHFPIWNCQSRVTVLFETVVLRNFIICLYGFKSFQYPAFTTSFINRFTGAAYCSTVFDMLESQQLDFNKKISSATPFFFLISRFVVPYQFCSLRLSQHFLLISTT